MREQEVYELVCSLVQQIIAEWNLEAPVGHGTRLIGELGFTSMDVIDLMSSLETKLGRKLPYDQLVSTEDGGYRQELTVDDVTKFVSANLGAAAGVEQSV